MATGLFFIANILFCLAYILRDILWLRVITIIAAASTLPYYGLRDEPLWSAVGWEIAFVVINGINLVQLLRERRPVLLSDAEREVHTLAFHTLTPRHARHLLRLGTWRNAKAGDQLITHHAPPDRVILLIDGHACVKRAETRHAGISRGMFIGEMGFLSGDPASADVIAATPVRYISWTRSALEQLMKTQPIFEQYLPLIFGKDMANKLRRRLDDPT